MAVFLVATALILSAIAIPNVLTQGRRERETEMIWRGQQYERAVGLYYRKFGKYPTKVDDLVKQTNGVRFLRQAYTDPMNKDDGSWRFIYVGPNGQLIGSSNQTNLAQGLFPQAAAVAGAGQFVAGSQAAPGSAATTFGAGGQPGGAAAPAPGAPAPNPQESQPQPLGGAVLGGNIIGVGSKVKQSSIRVYQGEDTYEKWEFIWNPNQLGQAIPSATPLNPAAPGATPPPGAPAPGTAPAPGSATPPDGTPPPLPVPPQATQ
jgi:type II secretory pathway pseudopilin PulG